MSEENTQETIPSGPNASDGQQIERVLVTGATGFVGRYVVRALLKRGITPVCLVRSPDKLRRILNDIDGQRYEPAQGVLSDPASIRRAAEGCDAVIHLVGIILEKPLKGQTFQKVNVDGTRAVLRAAESAGIKRYVHMSALGTRPDGVAAYHKTKWAAEQLVRDSALDWTIIRPSLIHGPDGEFMQLIKTFVTARLMPPVIPYFGDGQKKIQPVAVQDVAECFVRALDLTGTINHAYDLGGPRAYSWVELYQLGKRHIPGAKKSKPIVSMPVPVAKLVAATVMRTPLVPTKLKFNKGQVQMSQEDNACNITPTQNAFNIKFRDFEQELAQYADRI
jgi:NADH dehydrogenase